MNQPIKITLQVILIILSSTVFCVLVPTLTLLEIFLAAIGSLLIVGGWLLLVKEFNKLMDLKHRFDVQQELRELELQKQKQSLRRRGTTRTRGYYH